MQFCTNEKTSRWLVHLGLQGYVQWTRVFLKKKSEERKTIPSYQYAYSLEISRSIHRFEHTRSRIVYKIQRVVCKIPWIWSRVPSCRKKIVSCSREHAFSGINRRLWCDQIAIGFAFVLRLVDRFPQCGKLLLSKLHFVLNLTAVHDQLRLHVDEVLIIRELFFVQVLRQNCRYVHTALVDVAF